MVIFRNILVAAAVLWLPFSGHAHHDASLPETVPAMSLTAVDGSVQALDQYRGQVVLLDFWATWCHLCRELMPAHQAMYEKYKDQGFVIIGVAQDENPAVVHDWLAQRDIGFPILLDPAMQAAQAFTVIKLPTAILVDRTGKPIARFTGDHSDLAQELDAAVQASLATTAP